MEKVLFVKSSDYRNRLTNLKTSIVEIDGTRFAKKDNVYPEGKLHLESMLEYSLRLKEIFEPEYIVCPCEKKGDSLYFEYMGGRKFEEAVEEAAKLGNIDEIYDLLRRYHNLVWKMKAENGLNNIPSQSYKNISFAEVFGHQEFEPDIEFTGFANIDLIFSNIILDEKTCIIDYEWCYDFAIPLKYIFWRGLFTSKGISILDKEIQEAIYDDFGISRKLRTQFLEMETNFVAYTKKGNLSFGDEVSGMCLVTYNPNNFPWERKGYPIKCFLKKDGEVVEEVFCGVSYPGYNQISFSFKRLGDLIEAFVAPPLSIISDIRVFGVLDGCQEEIEYSTTSETKDIAPEFFIRNTSVIMFDCAQYNQYVLQFYENVCNEEFLGDKKLGRYISGIYRSYIGSAEDERISNDYHETDGQIAKDPYWVFDIHDEMINLRNKLSQREFELQKASEELAAKGNLLESLCKKNLIDAIKELLILRKKI